MSEDESLVARRSRRSTAGNRMQAALAEMALEDLTKEADDDVDFLNAHDEEDIFESDFESTDEEAAQEEDEDKAIRDEGNQERKAARAKAARAAAAAHDRHKVTFNPQAQAQPKTTHPEAPGSGTPTGSKLKRRVSLRAVVNAETGEVMTSKRQSQRKHTVMNTSETANRMKRSEEKRAAAVPKKMKSETRALTQDELISRALDNEEGNLVEHRDYLRLEEEKRKRARVIRTTVGGPLLSWISKREEVKVFEDPPAVPLPYSYGTTQPIVGSTTQQTPYALAAYATHQSTISPMPPSSSFPPPFTPSPYPPTQSPAPPLTSSVTPAPPPPRIERTEIVSKNYIIHELSQHESSLKPSWGDTMHAMFGDHVQWEDLRVFTGKGRPLARPKVVCPITGLVAGYRDPRTGVPFANVHAYETITRVLSHGYIWSDTLGCYVSPKMNGVATSSATPVPDQS